MLLQLSRHWNRELLGYILLVGGRTRLAKYDELAEFSGAGMVEFAGLGGLLVELLEQLLVLGRWKSYRSSDNNTGFIGCHLTVDVVINQHWGVSSTYLSRCGMA